MLSLRGLLLSGQHPEDLQPHGDHSGQGQPQGRRRGSHGIQRSGGIPEPPQRRQRSIHPPVAASDDQRGQAAQPDGQLLGERTAPPARPLRSGPDRREVHQRQRQPVARNGDHADRRRQNPVERIRRPVRHQAREPQRHHGGLRRHDPDSRGPGRGAEVALHGPRLHRGSDPRDQEFAGTDHQRLPRSREKRRGQQAGFGGDHLDEQHRPPARRRRDQHADRGLQRRRHRGQAPRIGCYGQVHQGPSGRYRTRAGRRGPQYRGHQEGQPDGGHHLGGRAQRVGKFALQDGRSFARKPDQRGGVHPHLPERPEKRR